MEMGKSTFPNRLVANVMIVVTGSPCFVKISTPAPIMLNPMNVPMPSPTTMTAPMILTLSWELSNCFSSDDCGCYMISVERRGFVFINQQ